MKALRVFLLASSALVPLSGTASGQPNGTTTVSAWAFQVRDGAPLTASIGFSRYKSDDAEVVAVIPHLPVGARVIAIQLAGCDESAAHEVQFTFGRVTQGAFTPLAAGSTGVSQAAGCDSYAVTLAVPHVVEGRSYIVSIRATGGESTRYSAVRVLYQLQVSTAPPTATFADVPVGNPYHRFVEAFVASGIAAGCAAGMYCPDQPVTRGELAVFLAAALGLHFPN